MKKKAKSARGKLGSEDAYRLRRLSEEARSRLLEIALILAHAGAKAVPPDGSIRLDSVRLPVPTAGGPGDWMEIVEGKDGEETCYGVIGGEPFYESPCTSP